MAWRCFRLTYELLGPLHIGYHKVGNVQRTRYYIPARNLWGAVTERLTRSGFRTHSMPEGGLLYQEIGEWIKQHLAFAYFFVRDEDESLLYPEYTDEGLCYRNLSAPEFERRFLSAHVTTALDAATTSAQEGSLHEVEFIASHDGSGRRTQLGGWVFLDEEGVVYLGGEEKWRRWLGGLQVGGERRYGFGRLRLLEDNWTESGDLFSGYKVQDGGRPTIEVDGNKPLLAHTIARGVDARGIIEPLVGRETRKGSQFGRALTKGQVCWAPGSIINGGTFRVAEQGVWEVDVKL